MFADGTIKTMTDKDGEIYINMLQLVDHLYNSAMLVRSADEQDSLVISQVLAMVAQEIAKYGLYLVTMDEFDQVDDVNSLMKIFSQES